MFLNVIKVGFKVDCSLFIRVNEYHLKGPFRGALLFTITVDKNHGIFPVVWVIIEDENGFS